MSGRLDIWAEASTGLFVPAVGTAARIRSCVCAASGGSVMPASDMASAIMMPKPPDAATSVTARVVGSRLGSSRLAAWLIWNRSSRLRTRNAPWRLNTASKTASDPASAPVCDAAAACPAVVAPILSITTGLRSRRAMSSAAVSLPASRQVSMQHKMRRVAGSCASAAMPSATSTSASLPVAMKRLTPMPRCAMLCMVKLPMLPDCETMPTGPDGGKACSSAMENEPTNRSVTLTVPRQLGPSKRTPWRRATSTNRS